MGETTNRARVELCPEYRLSQLRAIATSRIRASDSPVATRRRGADVPVRSVDRSVIICHAVGETPKESNLAPGTMHHVWCAQQMKDLGSCMCGIVACLCCLGPVSLIIATVFLVGAARNRREDLVDSYNSAVNSWKDGASSAF